MADNLSARYDGSFGGVSFWEQFDNGLSAAEPDIREEATIIHIPGSNNSVIQSTGKIARTLELPVAVMAAQLTSLRAKVGTTGTLVYHAGSASARLTGLSGARKVSLDSDGYLCTLSLVML